MRIAILLILFTSVFVTSFSVDSLQEDIIIENDIFTFSYNDTTGSGSNYNITVTGFNSTSFGVQSLYNYTIEINNIGTNMEDFHDIIFYASYFQNGVEVHSNTYDAIKISSIGSISSGMVGIIVPLDFNETEIEFRIGISFREKFNGGSDPSTNIQNIIVGKLGVDKDTNNYRQFVGQTNSGSEYLIKIAGPFNVNTLEVIDYEMSLTVLNYGVDIRDIYSVNLGALYMNEQILDHDNNRASSSKDSTTPFINGYSETIVKLSLNATYSDVSLYFYANFTEDEISGFDNGIRSDIQPAFQLELSSDYPSRNEHVKSNYRAVTTEGSEFSFLITGVNYGVISMNSSFNIMLTVDQFGLVYDFHDISITLIFYDLNDHMINNTTEEMENIDKGVSNSQNIDIDILLPTNNDIFYSVLIFEFTEDRANKFDTITQDEFLVTWMYEINRNGSIVYNNPNTELFGDENNDFVCSIKNDLNTVNSYSINFEVYGSLNIITETTKNVTVDPVSTEEISVTIQTENKNSTGKLRIILYENDIMIDMVTILFNITEKIIPQSVGESNNYQDYSENNNSPLFFPFIILLILPIIRKCIQ